MAPAIHPVARLRHALRPVRRFFRESRHRVLRRLGFLGEGWEEALPEELLFWENALKDGGRNWIRSEYEERLNPDLPLQGFLTELIPAAPGAAVRILDVGAGPLTRLGKHWPGRRLELTPVDPLAEQYRALLDRLGIRPPVFTEEGHGEKLQEQFGENFFDLAYASNSLDHSYDPMRAIRQMFAVVRPGCCVYLWHFPHVGVEEGYAGLHQWNFDIRDGDLILSDGRGKRHALREEFRGLGQTTCHFEKFQNHSVVVGIIRKQTVA